MHLGVVDHGARSPEQGPRVGSQHDQGPRGRARQPPSRVWAWQRKAIDVSSHISRGGDELCKSWPHMLLLGGTLIDTHSSVLAGVTHSVLLRYFSPPFLDFAHTVMDNTIIMRILCVIESGWSALCVSAKDRSTHLQPSCLSSAPCKLTVGPFPQCIFILSTVHLHSECGPPSRIGIPGSRCHFCRCNRLGRPLVYL